MLFKGRRRHVYLFKRCGKKIRRRGGGGLRTGPCRACHWKRGDLRDPRTFRFREEHHIEHAGRLDTLDAGDLTIEGRSLVGLTPKERTLYRKEEVGFVFQFYNLIPDLTVEENIEVVSDISESPLDLSEVLGALELEPYRRRFPRELSGGQQQRAAIARA